MLTRKHLICFLLCLFCLTTSGCAAKEQLISKTSDYDLVKQNDRYYIKLHDVESASSLMGSIVVEDPEFDSLSEMKQKIMTGNFTEREQQALSLMGIKYEGTIPICDLTNLCEPIFPKGIQYSKVIWFGETYSFVMDSASQVSGCLRVISQETYDRYLQEDFINFLENDNITLDSMTEDTVRGGTIYNYHTSITTLKAHMFTFTQDDKTIHVFEDYNSPYDTRPWSVTILGADGKNYYEVLIFDVTELPTTEWYLTFGLTPYVEDTEKA